MKNMNQFFSNVNLDSPLKKSNINLEEINNPIIENVKKEKH